MGEEEYDENDDNLMSKLKSFSGNQFRAVPSVPQRRQQFLEDGTEIPPPPQRDAPPRRIKKDGLPGKEDPFNGGGRADAVERSSDEGDWQESGSDSSQDSFEDNRVYEMRGVPPPPHRDVPQF